jgi:hypothetical protein
VLRPCGPTEERGGGGGGTASVVVEYVREVTMDENEFYAVYGEVERGTMIKVTWSVPAVISGEGREVLFSDQGVFEGIENGAVFIRRTDGTLRIYLMSSIQKVEVIS